MAIKELNGLGNGHWNKTNAILNRWIRNGLDRGFKQNAIKGGIPKESLEQISAALKEPILMSQIKKGIQANLQEINENLVKYSASSFDYGSGILRQKKYKRRK